MTRNRKLATTVIAVLAFTALATVGTLAVFTDDATVGANAFDTGSVEISTMPTTAAVSFTDMMPGDQVTNDLVVTNDGESEFRYAVSSTATNTDSKGLKDQLVLTIKSGVTGTDCADFTTSGAVVYTGDLDGSTGALVGDSTQGAQTGDRTLAASATETLCFRVALPLSTGNAFQNAATTATFTFSAEQTANNP